MPLKSQKSKPVILLGIDAAVGTLTEKYLDDGSMQNFEKLIAITNTVIFRCSWVWEPRRLSWQWLDLASDPGLS